MEHVIDSKKTNTYRESKDKVKTPAISPSISINVVLFKYYAKRLYYVNSPTISKRKKMFVETFLATEA